MLFWYLMWNVLVGFHAAYMLCLMVPSKNHFTYHRNAATSSILTQQLFNNTAKSRASPRDMSLLFQQYSYLLAFPWVSSSLKGLPGNISDGPPCVPATKSIHSSVCYHFSWGSLQKSSWGTCTSYRAGLSWHVRSESEVYNVQLTLQGAV